MGSAVLKQLSCSIPIIFVSAFVLQSPTSVVMAVVLQDLSIAIAWAFRLATFYYIPLYRQATLLELHWLGRFPNPAIERWRDGASRGACENGALLRRCAVCENYTAAGSISANGAENSEGLV